MEVKDKQKRNSIPFRYTADRIFNFNEGAFYHHSVWFSFFYCVSVCGCFVIRYKEYIVKQFPISSNIIMCQFGLFFVPFAPPFPLPGFYHCLLMSACRPLLSSPKETELRLFRRSFEGNEKERIFLGTDY